MTFPREWVNMDDREESIVLGGLYFPPTIGYWDTNEDRCSMVNLVHVPETNKYIMLMMVFDYETRTMKNYLPREDIEAMPAELPNVDAVPVEMPEG